MIRIETLTVYNCLVAFLHAYKGQEWTGTARQLLEALQPHVTRWPRGKLPTNERALVVELKKVCDLACVSLSYTREGKQRARSIHIHKLERASFPPRFFTFL